MKQRIKGEVEKKEEQPKMVLFSAHDTTILTFGAALNFLNMDCLIDYFYNGANNSETCINQYPDFATNYVIELWVEDDQTHSISVNLYFT